MTSSSAAAPAQQEAAEATTYSDLAPHLSSLSKEQIDTLSLKSLKYLHDNCPKATWDLFLVDLSHTTAKRQWKKIRNRLLQKIKKKIKIKEEKKENNIQEAPGSESKQKENTGKTHKRTKKSRPGKLSRKAMQRLHDILNYRMKLTKSWDDNLLVCIDCHFDDKMTPQELRSLASQLTHTYSANTKLEQQSWYMMFCGLTGTFKKVMDALSFAYASWRIDVRDEGLLESMWIMDRVFKWRKEFLTDHQPPTINGPYKSVYSFIGELDSFVDDRMTKAISDRSSSETTQENKQEEGASTTSASLIPTLDDLSSEEFHSVKHRAVYLTADSPNVIDELVPGEMYIIGGIVDRNRHKNLCLNRAKELGIRHARFPIEDILEKELSASTVMTVNQCFELMAERHKSGSWEEAVRAVFPQRKRKREATDEESNPSQKQARTEDTNNNSA